MGISDDIRPKTYRPIKEKVHKTEIKIAQKQIDERDDGQMFQASHDGDFFANTPIGDSDKKVRKIKSGKGQINNNHRWVYSVIIAIAICTLLSLVVWQNYATIKSYINGSYKNKNNQNLTDIINSTNDSNNNYNSGTQTPAASTDTTTTQTPTAAPTIDKSTITISVLNGSGVKNSASIVANTLKTAGFTIKSTGNARSFNYTKTYIYYKTDDVTKANLVKDSLPDRQTEVSKNTSVVGSAYDIVVVVGKQ